VIIGRDIGFGLIGIRPDPVPEVPTWIADSVAPGGRRINPAAFRVPPEVRQGNLARNSIRGFGFRQVDLSLRRDFRISGPSRLQFRVDLFNLLNTPNFAAPNATLGVVSPAGVLTPISTFGVSTAMLNSRLGGLSPLYQIGGPRSVQLSARVSF
jgi:hypothetical protein